MTSQEIQNTMAEVLSKQVYLPDVSPDKIIVNETIPQNQFKITVRLSKTYSILPTPDQIINEYNRTGKKGEGAPWLLFGMIQIVGDKLRITTRIIRTETSVIARSSLGDGDNSAAGLNKAFQIALTNLGINFVS